MDTYMIDTLEMNGLTHDQITELFNASDYLLAAEMNLSSKVSSAQRRGQLADLMNAQKMIQCLKNQSPHGYLKQWLTRLENNVQRCIIQVRSLLAYHEVVGQLTRCQQPNSSAE